MCKKMKNRDTKIRLVKIRRPKKINRAKNTLDVLFMGALAAIILILNIAIMMESVTAGRNFAGNNKMAQHQQKEVFF